MISIVFLILLSPGDCLLIAGALPCARKTDARDMNQKKRFTCSPFGVRFLKTATIDGRTVPVETSGGWNYGTPAYEETIHLRFTGVGFI